MHSSDQSAGNRRYETSNSAGGPLSFRSGIGGCGAGSATGILRGCKCTATQASSGYQFPPGPTTTSAGSLDAIATFHSIGLYWDEASGSNGNEALMRFRPVSGTTAWRQGL